MNVDNLELDRISITDIENVFIGQVEDEKGGTGCTVFIAPDGMPAGLDIRGGGPASRESSLMAPLSRTEILHGIVLAGGSAYGLDAAGGVMRYLEEQGIGLHVADSVVPLVCQADIFDLNVGDPKARPDVAMGYEAAKRALTAPNYKDGNYGAGCGATVGKICGNDLCMKGGIGSFAIQMGELQIGAVVVVNAVGDVYDWTNSNKLAGVRHEGTNTMLTPTQTRQRWYQDQIAPMHGANTTLGVILTNGKFSKAELSKIASMAHDGYAMAISPVHTTMDGDSIYALSTGNVTADIDSTGVMASCVMAEAIYYAVNAAETAYGIPSIKDVEPMAETEKYILPEEYRSFRLEKFRKSTKG